MAEVKTKTKTTTKTGSKLKKKIGPFPIWSLLALAGIVLLYLYMKHRASSDAGTQVTGNASGFLTPQPTVTPQQAASAGAPSQNSAPGSQLDPAVLDQLSSALGGGVAYPTDYVTQSDFDSQVKNLNDSLTGAIASATFQGASVASTKTTSAKSTLPVKATATKSAPVHYFTYAPGKAPKGKQAQQAPAKVAGKTLHFAKGKGYYYA